MLTLSGLKAMVAVAETGGIRGAANRLGRTPSAISMTLKQLEDEVGAPLFEGERKSRLTKLGQLVVQEGRGLLEHYERASAAMRAFADNQVGRCDIACVPSVAVAFLPTAILRLCVERPSFDIQLRDMDSRAVIEAVSADTVEIGFASLPSPVPGLAFSPIFADRLDIVCSEEDPLVEHHGPIPWREVVRRKFLGNGSYSALSTPEFLSIIGQSEVHVRNVTSLLAMVRAGVGITLLPRLCRLQGGEGLRFLPVDDANAYRVVGMIAKQGRAHLPATNRLVEVVLDVIAERAGDLEYELLLRPKPLTVSAARQRKPR
ncbi:MAG TPA: LysR family transcriptional regulator [Alphaproteobacteria bacterium]|nr:LysR family transcriptional regulator [Alphaproteobacteria bacterium]